MSAIYGYRQWNTNTAMPHLIAKMQSVYESRCKIDRYAHTDGDDFAMGCGIQYITAESKKERLPIQEDGVYFNADCMLDNREELLSLLNLDDDETPDGDLLYYAYRRWGMEFFDYVRGIYSCVIDDRRTGEFILAVDPVGSRCLYYSLNESMVLYSTLIDPIRTVRPDTKRNEAYYQDFLAAPGLMPNLVPGETPWENIHQVVAGHYVVFRDGKMRDHRHFHIEQSSPDCNCRNAEEYGAYFRNLFTSCVRDEIRSDAPVSVSMSSGLDSASIAALAADILKEEKRELYTYTYVPAVAPEQVRVNNQVFDETEDVRAILSMHSNMVATFLNNEGRNCLENLDRELEILEIPVKAYVNFANLCEIYEKVSEHGGKILLTGQCGNASVSHGYIDDVLYELYYENRLIEMAALINQYCPKAGESRKEALRSCMRYFKYAKQLEEHADAGFTYYEPTNPFVDASYFSDQYDVAKRLRLSGLKHLENIPQRQEAMRDFLVSENAHTYIGTFETKFGLYYGIILRDPTKDIRILRFCYHLPYKLFCHRGIPRWLIRGNMTDILPEKLLMDLNRYGVQNADCYDRIVRDWELLQDILDKRTLQRYTNTEKLRRFLDDFPTTYRQLQNQNDHKGIGELTWKFDQAIFSLIALR